MAEEDILALRRKFDKVRAQNKGALDRSRTNRQQGLATRKSLVQFTAIANSGALATVVGALGGDATAAIAPAASAGPLWCFGIGVILSGLAYAFDAVLSSKAAAEEIDNYRTDLLSV